MNFSLTQDQSFLYDSALKFCNVLNVNVNERIAKACFDREAWDKASDFGYAGFPIPQDLGGSGLSAFETILMNEAYGEACADLGLSFSLSAHAFAVTVPVWRFGSSEIQLKYLEALATGRLIGANAATEPEAGSDIFSMKTRADRFEGGYLINGGKCFITNGPVADVFLVYAKTDKNRGYFGISAFLVNKDNPGLKVSKNRKKNSLKTSTWSDVFLDNCYVDENAMVGEPGVGGTIFYDSMVWEKGCLFAMYVGAMERTLKASIEHVNSRVQFGKTISSYQSVSNRLVDMKIRLEGARLMLYKAGWLYDNGEEFETAIAMSKIMVSQSAFDNGLAVIDTFGGAALEESGMDQLLLDAIPARIFSGSNDIQRAIIAKKMGLGTS